MKKRALPTFTILTGLTKNLIFPLASPMNNVEAVYGPREGQSRAAH